MTDTIGPLTIAAKVGNSAQLDVGTVTGTVAAGDDARITTTSAAVRLYKRATLK